MAKILFRLYMVSMILDKVSQNPILPMHDVYHVGYTWPKSDTHYAWFLSYWTQLAKILWPLCMVAILLDTGGQNPLPPMRSVYHIYWTWLAKIRYPLCVVPIILDTVGQNSMSLMHGVSHIGHSCPKFYITMHSVSHIGHNCPKLYTTMHGVYHNIGQTWPKSYTAYAWCLSFWTYLAKIWYLLCVVPAIWPKSYIPYARCLSCWTHWAKIWYPLCVVPVILLVAEGQNPLLPMHGVCHVGHIWPKSDTTYAWCLLFWTRLVKILYDYACCLSYWAQLTKILYPLCMVPL